jgi:hypothetical protein
MGTFERAKLPSAAEMVVSTGTAELRSTGRGTGETMFAHTVVPGSGFASGPYTIPEIVPCTDWPSAQIELAVNSTGSRVPIRKPLRVLWDMVVFLYAWSYLISI